MLLIVSHSIYSLCTRSKNIHKNSLFISHLSLSTATCIQYLPMLYIFQKGQFFRERNAIRTTLAEPEQK